MSHGLTVRGAEPGPAQAHTGSRACAHAPSALCSSRFVPFWCRRFFRRPILCLLKPPLFSPVRRCAPHACASAPAVSRTFWVETACNNHITCPSACRAALCVSWSQRNHGRNIAAHYHMFLRKPGLCSTPGYGANGCAGEPPCGGDFHIFPDYLVCVCVWGGGFAK